MASSLAKTIKPIEKAEKKASFPGAKWQTCSWSWKGKKNSTDILLAFHDYRLKRIPILAFRSYVLEQNIHNIFYFVQDFAREEEDNFTIDLFDMSIWLSATTSLAKFGWKREKSSSLSLLWLAHY